MSDSESVASTAKKQGYRWPRGKSGNPKGRPAGSRNRASLIAEVSIGGQTEELAKKAIAMALNGDVVALRLCLERVLPPARERPCLFRMPKLQTTSDAIAVLALVSDGLAKGELLPYEAEALCNVVATFTKTIELTALEDRLEALERGRAEDLAERGRHYDA
jgi:Family of unknown function (DUF5681)